MGASLFSFPVEGAFRFARRLCSFLGGAELDSFDECDEGTEMGRMVLFVEDIIYL